MDYLRAMNRSAISQFLIRTLSVSLAMTAGAKISFELSGISATMQTFFLCLTALYLKPAEVLTGQLLYLALGFFVPVFSSDYMGVDAFTGPTAGFLYGFPVAAWFMARNTHRGQDWFTVLSWCVLAHFIVLLAGVLWLIFGKGRDLGTAFFTGMLNFLPWAFVKSCVVTGIYIIAETLANRKKGGLNESA